MDSSDDNYSNQGDDFEYDPTPFYTDQAFESPEELMNWAQATALSLGYVLVKGRSNRNLAGLFHKVLLVCDRGGVYRDRGSSSARSTSTKKINCPFKLQGYLTESYDWRVIVKDHRHNHLRTDYLEGHAYARRLSRDEKEWLEHAAMLNLQPRYIFAGLKREFPHNMSTIKDIYNALDKIKDEAADQVGETPMQVSSPQCGTICVQGYNVKWSVAPIVEAIFKKHGDIAAECLFKTASARSYFLEVVCEVVTRIETDDVIDKMEEIECQVSDAEAANINVSWLRAHLEAIHKRKEAMKRSDLLMETKVNTSLVKRAAQMDLRERCEELMTAQERFEKAERCFKDFGNGFQVYE